MAYDTPLMRRCGLHRPVIRAPMLSRSGSTTLPFWISGRPPSIVDCGMRDRRNERAIAERTGE